MRYVSLFAGIGGFDLALNRLGHECVYANDFDKYAAETYNKNFCTNKERQGQTEMDGGKDTDPQSRRGIWESNAHPAIDTTSITEVRAEDIPDHDLLVGGFPCQAFSIAGKRKGFDDTRGTLFFDVARIVKAKRPKYLVLENVKGLLSHDKGRTYKVILSTLTELGYDIQSMVLNSKNFGVPQNRERVFIVGHLRGTGRPKIFPLTPSSGEDLQQNRETQSEGERVRRPYFSATVDANYYKGAGSTRQMIEITEKVGDGQWIYDVNGISKTLKGEAGEQGAKTGLYQLSDMRVRRLTPTECERLQGFPDGWTEGVSDTQRYKQLGNAVTVNVVYEVAKRL